MIGDDMSPEQRRGERLKIDPVQIFVPGKDRVPMVRAIGADWPMAKAVDRAVDTLNDPVEHKKAREQMAEISREASLLRIGDAGLSLRDVVVAEAMAALSKVPAGSERRGGEVSKVLVEAAINSDSDVQEMLDGLVADGQLDSGVADRVSGWAHVELLRLAAHAKESSRMGGRRQVVMKALKPVSGQIDTGDWNDQVWSKHVKAAKGLVEEPKVGVGQTNDQSSETESEPKSFAERAIRTAEKFFKDPKNLGWVVFLGDEALETLPKIARAYFGKYKDRVEAKGEEAVERTKERIREYAAGIRPAPPSEEEIDRTRRLAEAQEALIQARKGGDTPPVGEVVPQTVTDRFADAAEKFADTTKDAMQMMQELQERNDKTERQKKEVQEQLRIIELSRDTKLIETTTWALKEAMENKCQGCGASLGSGANCEYCNMETGKATLERAYPTLEKVTKLVEMMSGRKGPGEIGGRADSNVSRERNIQQGQIASGENSYMVGGDTYTEEVILDIPKMFSERWLKDRGLPAKVVMKTMFPDKFRVLDMRYMVNQLFAGHPTEGFDAESIRRGLELEERERAATEGDEANFSGITEKATDSFNHFMWGDYKVMRLIQAETNGTLRAWVGADGASGILNQERPNMKWVAHQILKDPHSLSAMRVWVALGGTAEENFSYIAGMTQQEMAIVRRHFQQFKVMMKVKDYKRLPDGTVNERDVLMSRELGVKAMDEVEKEMVEMGLDAGSVKMTRMVADLIAWNPETVDARKQFANFDNFLKGDSKAAHSLIGRTMYTRPDENSEALTFADGLSTGGIESLLTNIESWTHSSVWLPMAYGGMQNLLKSLQILKDMEKGDDVYSNLTQRRAAVKKIIDDLMVHKEFPPVDENTANAWRKWKFELGKGKHLEAQRYGVTEVGLMTREAFGGEISAVKKVLRRIFGGNN